MFIDVVHKCVKYRNIEHRTQATQRTSYVGARTTTARLALSRMDDDDNEKR